MVRHCTIQLTVVLSLALLTHAWSSPIAWIRRHTSSASSVTEGSWLWGWAWGGDSSISIVDRTPFQEFGARHAAFGAYISDPLLGYVIPLASFTRDCDEDEEVVLGRTDIIGGTAKENLGCPRLCAVEGRQPDSSESWIALVQRGSCQFVDKAREAQRLGAKGIVVGGDDPAISGNPDGLINMFSPGDSSDVEIAATFIKYSDYLHLASLIATSNTSHNGIRTLSLLVSPGSSTWDWYSPIVTFAILLLLPSSLTLTTLLVHRVRAARQAQLDRAPEDIVNSLPWRVWTGTGWEKHSGPVDRPTTPDIEEGLALSASPNEARMSVGMEDLTPSTSSRRAAGATAGTAAGVPETGCCTEAGSSSEQHPAWFDNQSECAICLSEFARGDKVRVLPCNHIFHLSEVDEWLTQRKKLCPVCKADVTRPQPSLPLSEEPSSDEQVDESTTPHLPRRSYGGHTASSRSPSPPLSVQRSTPPATERTPLLQRDSTEVEAEADAVNTP